MAREGVALVIGVGGLGCPAALALARSGARLLLCDDDVVDVTNLHRQVLFSEADLGHDKLDVAKERLLEAGAPSVELHRGRFLPESARELVERADVIVEGADNFATKFLAADAAHLGEKPVVHGAGVRWGGTALLVRAAGAPCYRCLFEDVPDEGAAPNCATAGVIGPVVGVIGALMADLALDVLTRGNEDGPRAPASPAQLERAGLMHSYDGKRDVLRAVPIHARADCPLCGPSARLTDLDERRYLAPSCAAVTRYGGAPHQKSPAATATFPR